MSDNSAAIIGSSCQMISQTKLTANVDRSMARVNLQNKLHLRKYTMSCYVMETEWQTAVNACRHILLPLTVPVTFALLVTRNLMKTQFLNANSATKAGREWTFRIHTLRDANSAMDEGVKDGPTKS